MDNLTDNLTDNLMVDLPDDLLVLHSCSICGAFTQPLHYAVQLMIFGPFPKDP